MVILPCSCRHKSQDELHGAGNRAHTVSIKQGKARCTVCGRDKPLPKKFLEEKHE